MSNAMLRWGGGLGLVGAGLGIAALLIGAFFFPIPPSTTAEVVAVAILVRGVLALIALGVTLGLSYYAGVRVERDRRQDLPASTTLPTSNASSSLNAGNPLVTLRPAEAAPANERIGSLLAGLLVAFCWWFGTTLTGYLLPLLPQTASSAADSSQLVQRLILGAIIVILGTGLGGMGSRAVAARTLISQIVIPAPAAASITSITSTISTVPSTTSGADGLPTATANALPIAEPVPAPVASLSELMTRENSLE